MTDVLFINPASSKEVYQNLSNEYSAIGTPYWALLLAESCRSKKHKVKIIDVLAEKLDDDTFIKRVFDINPKLIVFCVYGENVNGGTAQMEGALPPFTFSPYTQKTINFGFISKTRLMNVSSSSFSANTSIIFTLCFLERQDSANNKAQYGVPMAEYSFERF
jgi:hypothetical protein